MSAWQNINMVKKKLKSGPGLLSALWLVSLTCLSFGLPSVLAASADAEPTFKSDVPKLDLAPTTKHNAGASSNLLKGNIEHHIKAAPPPRSKPKRLNSRIARPDFNMGGALKGAADRGDKGLSLQSRLQEPYTLDKSVGIIGIKFMKVGDQPAIVNRVFPGTPAYNCGFSVDDRIVAVDGVPIAGLTKDECYDLIVGTPKTPITVTLMHHGSFEVKNMSRMDFNDIPDPMVRRDYLHSL